MKTNKERFLKLVSGEKSEVSKDIYKRINQPWRRESKLIAIKIIKALREKGLTQKGFADLMGVTPQYVSKLVKGQENLTIETMVKIQDVLDISILDIKKEEKESYCPVVFTDSSSYSPTNTSDYSDFNEFSTFLGKLNICDA